MDQENPQQYAENQQQSQMGVNRGDSSNVSDEAKKKAEEYGIPEQYLEQEEFHVPTETVILPSKGKFYDDGKDRVEIKYPTAAEDDILYSDELIKSGKVFNVLLQHCILDKDIDPKDLITGDRDYILIQLAKNGISDEYSPGKMRDPSSGEMWEPVIDLNQLKPKFLDNEPDENGEFDFHFPNMKVDIKFRMLRGHDEDKIEKKESAKKNSQIGAKVSNTNSEPYYSKVVTERYKLQIMEVNGQRDKLKVAKLVDSLPMKDSRTFREYVRRISPGVDLTYQFETPSGYVYEDEVPLNHKLFYPDASVT